MLARGRFGKKSSMDGFSGDGESNRMDKNGDEMKIVQGWQKERVVGNVWPRRQPAGGIQAN